MHILLHMKRSFIIIKLVVFVTIFSLNCAKLAHAVALNSLTSSVFVPLIIPEPDPQGVIRVPSTKGISLPLTINPFLQRELKKFLVSKGDPIATVVVVEVKTGKILAMVQGQNPSSWHSPSHTALYTGFPAASLFKTIPTIAALELADFEPESSFAITDSCSKDFTYGGQWIRKPSYKPHMLSLSSAFAHSCNSFFARITVSHIGLGAINKMAQEFGWGKKIPADFDVPMSPIVFPSPTTAGLQEVGRFSAGFGRVGLSAIHAAWLYLIVANDGVVNPLNLISTNLQPAKIPYQRLYSAETGIKLRSMLQGTVRSGTASSIFRKKPYSSLRFLAGGKTGTLQSLAPSGLTTWFAGLMPYNDPQVVVAAVVINDNRWVIKGPHLAAEAFRLWDLIQKANKGTFASARH